MVTKLRLVASLVLLCSAIATARADEYRLYFLAGQSNMEGYGYNDELPERYRKIADRIMIFTGAGVGDREAGGGAGAWDKLQPGHGTGFRSDGERNRLSDRFGPELTFGWRLAELDPDANIAIVKYSRGGSTLQLGASGYGTWEPDFDGINQYDNALTTIRTALAARDIDGDRVVDRLRPAGIVWMQGESDAYHSQAAADAYAGNLKRMMDLLRAALRVDDLPVVIGKITDSGRADDGKLMDYIDTVQQAQLDFADKDACATVVTVTDELSYPSDDDWHYDSAGYVRLGIAFADAASELSSTCNLDSRADTN